MDLARDIKKEPSLSIDSKEPKVIYPSFTIRDKAATDFCKEYDCEVGSECAGTVKLRITAKRDDQFGKEISFEIHELDDIAEEISEGGDEKSLKKESEASKVEPADDSGEEKILGYKRPDKLPKKEKVKADSSFLDKD